MQNGKWIHDLTPDMSLPKAARRVLDVRLEVVCRYLPLAVHRPEEDAEYVHQLRVGTRRTGAALEIFCLCLSEKAYRKARTRLHGIRRAAGEARDWDVFLDSLATQKRIAAHQAGLDFLAGYAFNQRSTAQVNLENANKNPSDFARFQTRLVAAVREPVSKHAPETLSALARPMLTQLLRELDEAAARDLSDYGHLHQVRIVGKRLRYAMEIFADCFGPTFKEQLYTAVEEMQDILGRANDSHVASQHLSELRDRLRAARPKEWRRLKAGIDGVLHYHQRRLPQERRCFLKWWSTWRETGTESAFANLLKTGSS